MLTNFSILTILREASLVLGRSIDLTEIKSVEMNHRGYTSEELAEFKRDLTEAGHHLRILFADLYLPEKDFEQFFEEQENPLLVFQRDSTGITPILLTPGRVPGAQVLRENNIAQVPLSPELMLSLVRNEESNINHMSIVAYDSPFNQPTDSEVEISPIKRLIRLLSTERKELAYILVYAMLVGVVSLILPVGIQTTVELISGGVVFSSVYVMIGLVLAGVIIAGILQLVQMSMVEFLQRRVFVKAAFEFAFRLPRLQLEALRGKYTPELVNRFFEVMTIQKGLPKLLIDLSSAVVQILVGLLLISLYHPFFVLFGFVLLVLLTILFLITGPRGLRSSILESKYKYRVVHWLEELGRAAGTFKMAGNSDLPIRETDYNVNNYLKNRRSHFKVLMTQFSFIIFFKAAVTGGLLIVGTMLVVDRQITLGQFVASEIVIILILNAVEKIIMNLDVVYDLLTAVDKLAHVTDLPVERTGGLDFPSQAEAGIRVEVSDLSYSTPAGKILTGINLTLSSGERVCLAGPGSSGKTTLCNILSGLYIRYEGAVMLDGYSMRDLDLTNLRERIGRNGFTEDIFEGSVLDNLTVGNRTVTAAQAMAAAERIGLSPELSKLADGLSTPISSGGRGSSSSVNQKILLCRSLAKRPRLLILDNFVHGLSRSEKLSLIESVAGEHHPWTLVIVSNDPLVMAACDRVIVMDQGRIHAQGTLEELLKDNSSKNLIG